MPTARVRAATRTRAGVVAALAVVLAIAVMLVLRAGRSAADRDWEVVFHGYGPGLTRIAATDRRNAADPDDADVIELAPGAATSAGTTHAVLAVRRDADDGTGGTDPCADSVVDAEMRTLAQLRRGSAANPWEVAWLVWRYRDPEHFYYLALKPNGWEVGKRDPAYPGGQRFLATGETPFPVGAAWHRAEVSIATVDGRATASVRVDDVELGRVDDGERPYTCGRTALYTEDARVQFRSVRG